jgi:UDP-N-acetylmuramate--alanine ligase
VVTYGEGPEARVRAEAVLTESLGSRFTVVAGERSLGELWLPAPGRHNVANALAAVAIGLELGVPFGAIRERLAGFAGVARRFEHIGERNGVTVVDDYAHHPTELRATLAAARQAYPGRRVVAVFQPHLFSRTRDFADGFADALAAADLAVLLPIYPARERPLPGVSSDLVAHALALRASTAVHRADSIETAVGLLDTLTREGDVVVTLGAGDVFRLGPLWLGGRS